jgi:hypothetical protein
MPDPVDFPEGMFRRVAPAMGEDSMPHIKKSALRANFAAYTVNFSEGSLQEIHSDSFSPWFVD